MRTRALRISLLVVMTIWFGVVVPLHPRGIIKLGGACAEMGGRACCRQESSSNHDSKPKPADSSCAICYFVATLDLPPAMGMDVPALGLVARVNPVVLPVAPVIEWVDACSERGPPGV